MQTDETTNRSILDNCEVIKYADDTDVIHEYNEAGEVHQAIQRLRQHSHIVTLSR